ncbi:unnamed protein product [Acanthoscelides obtectus]|uniref:Uncharacterized protein n=1 Tax=Acanthoscelides obtectus TaxID=200917 RepID=A0A9P0NYW5_ACAOB|nr:unnamed protein product [Acanthoscelides obtectus]CAK1671214.1 hypothetical protein AOBTE_LOCUS28151 [Acanthoscelides obtectus]
MVQLANIQQNQEMGNQEIRTDDSNIIFEIVERDAVPSDFEDVNIIPVNSQHNDDIASTEVNDEIGILQPTANDIFFKAEKNAPTLNEFASQGKCTSPT